MQNRYLVGSVAAALVILGLLFFQRQPQPVVQNSSEPSTSPDAVCMRLDGTAWNFAEGVLNVGGEVFSIAVADTPPERAAGLSGCSQIPVSSGMYFPFASAVRASFWMKDMVIPIDIVWVAGGEVIGIEHNIQPEPGVAEADLTRYMPPQPVEAVLELTAGEAARRGITVGDSVVRK